MKNNLFAAIMLTLLCLVLFSGVYTAAIWGVAQLSNNTGKGELVEAQGKKYYANIGQSFTDDKYFYSRPSAVGYNAAGSAGSNKGPSNAEYLTEVQGRIDTFLVHNPAVEKASVPVELVTASGSGLDPDISPKAAAVQVKRIASVRNIPEGLLNQLIAKHTQHALLGIFGPEKINVLKLNLALDAIK